MSLTDSHFQSESNPGVIRTGQTPIGGVVVRSGINQIRGINVSGATGSGIPKPVTDVKVSIANAQTGATCAVSIQFKRDPSDQTFSGVNIWVRGYQGNSQLVQVASGTTSPTTFVLNNTGETVSFLIQAFGNGGNAPFTTSPTASGKLPKSTGGGYGTTTTVIASATLVAGDNVTITTSGNSSTIAAATSYRTAGQEWIISWDSFKGQGVGGVNNVTWISGGAAANTVTFVQLNLRETVTIRKVTAMWGSNSAGGPHFSSCAIYDLTGATKLLDAGTNAFSDANITTPQTVTLGAAVTLTPGCYLVAWSATVNAGGANGGLTLNTNQEVAMFNNTYTRYGRAANAMSGGAMPSSLGALTARNVADSLPGFIFES